ncbi:MAG: FCD domain-containing protein [Microbacterium sp.]
MQSVAWEPVRHGSVSDLIARQILAVIAREKLAPGDRLPPERELASLLGVGRPALREALGALKAQGRVSIRHGIGVFVADPESTRALRSAFYSEELNFEELFEMREMLEVAAATWAAEKQDADRLRKLTDAYDVLTAASLEDDVDWKKLQELDARFHLRIFEAAGNRFLSGAQGVLQDLLATGMATTLQVPGRLEKSRTDHREIYEAIVAGEPAVARRAIRKHIRGARKAALDRMRG